MASSLALRRAASSALFNRLVNPIRAASAAAPTTRFFNTNTQMTSYDDDERSVDGDRRSVSQRREAFPSLFSDVFDPFSAPRNVNQLLHLLDPFIENPVMATRGPGPRRGWDVREDTEALYIKMDMPGLDKENVKITVEENTLIIKGEGEKESESDEDEYGRRRYSSRLELPEKLFKTEGIKAEMKNGVLKVVIPKIKEEERKDVYQVKVE